jgi:hypothetical protein
MLQEQDLGVLRVGHPEAGTKGSRRKRMKTPSRYPLRARVTT